MTSIHGKEECALAALQVNKQCTDVEVVSTAFGKDRPTGCSWHNNGNLELWKSSSGKCTVNGYAGCFCKKVSGE